MKNLFAALCAILVITLTGIAPAQATSAETEEIANLKAELATAYMELGQNWAHTEERHPNGNRGSFSDYLILHLERAFELGAPQKQMFELLEQIELGCQHGRGHIGDSVRKLRTMYRVRETSCPLGRLMWVSKDDRWTSAGLRSKIDVGQVVSLQEALESLEDLPTNLGGPINVFDGRRYWGLEADEYGNWAAAVSSAGDYASECYVLLKH